MKLSRRTLLVGTASQFLAKYGRTQEQENKPVIGLPWIDTGAPGIRCWKVWFADLVDWGEPGHPPYKGPMPWVQSYGSAGYSGYVTIRTSTQETAYVCQALAEASGISVPGWNKPLPAKYKRNASKEAASQFQSLLLQLKPPIVPVVTVHAPTGVATAETVRQIKRAIHAFETFPQEFPHDPYLNGYARLYGAILRVVWSDNFSTTLSKLEGLQQDYRESPEIAIMAAWYKALLLAWYKKPETKKAFNQLATQYKDHDWSVIHSARLLAEKKITTWQQWPPDIKDEIERSIVTFFWRKTDNKGISV